MSTPFSVKSSPVVDIMTIASKSLSFDGSKLLGSSESTAVDAPVFSPIISNAFAPSGMEAW